MIAIVGSLPTTSPLLVVVVVGASLEVAGAVVVSAAAVVVTGTVVSETVVVVSDAEVVVVAVVVAVVSFASPTLMVRKLDLSSKPAGYRVSITDFPFFL